jgi:hypothetical protein
VEAFTEASIALGGAAFELLRERLMVEQVKSSLERVNEQVEAARVAQQSLGEIATSLRINRYRPSSSRGAGTHNSGGSNRSIYLNKWSPSRPNLWTTNFGVSVFC